MKLSDGEVEKLRNKLKEMIKAKRKAYDEMGNLSDEEIEFLKSKGFKIDEENKQK